MTAVNDKAGETGIDMAETPCLAAEASAGRDMVTREVCRGVGRLLRALSFAVVNELPWPTEGAPTSLASRPPVTSGSSR